MDRRNGVEGGRTSQQQLDSDLEVRDNGEVTSRLEEIAEPALEQGEKGPPAREQLGGGGSERGMDETAGQDVEASEETELDEAIAEPALERGSTVPGSIKSGSRPTLKRTPSSPVAPHSLLLLQLATYSLLVFITIWGVLARLGLKYLGSFATSQVFSTIWPQMVGCLLMGFVVCRKKGLERVYPPLFVMMGTGFCGSLTTFSSWMFDVFVAFAQLDSTSYSPNRFSGFSSGLANTLITLSVATTSLLLGTHLSSLLPSARPSSLRHARHPPNPYSRPLPYHLVSLLLGPLFWIGALLLLIFGPSSYRGKATFAIVLGPPGTILRYELSRALNKLHPAFPVGTLAANSFAVLIFGISALLQRNGPTSLLGCAALQGVQDGFCGSLSTVSTFVVELRGLGRKESYRYFGASWLIAQMILVLLLGSWVWSGERSAVCTY